MLENATWKQRLDEVAREDLVMFINAALACSGQREFYDDAYGQRLSIDFLHDYILGNYRRLYARTLAAGINQLNQAEIILKLLASGKGLSPDQRQEEGLLILASLNAMPPQRAWRLLGQFRQRQINNRRSRAIARDYLRQRRNAEFEAIKYRAKIRLVASHNHLSLPGELGKFIFEHSPKQTYETPLFEQFRQAHYQASAIYNLPFTIAEGLAAKHGIAREQLLTKMQDQMTVGEKLRHQSAAAQLDVTLNLDWQRLSLTKLVLYWLSFTPAERQTQRAELAPAMQAAAARTIRKAGLKLGKVAAVLDCSYSSFGSSEKRRRPLAIALAVDYLLQAAAQFYHPFWTAPLPDPLMVVPRGQTDLATPLLAALASQPDLVVIVSDGYENSPPTGACTVLELYRHQLDPERRTAIVHCNPVFDADTYGLKRLHPQIPTVGLRDAEDLPMMLGFARFAEGAAPLAELEAYLALRVQELLQKQGFEQGFEPVSISDATSEPP
jgi:hypothetical protein